MNNKRTGNLKLCFTALAVFAVITVFNLSCFDMYNEIADNADPGKYKLTICETLYASYDARLLQIQSDGSFKQSYYTIDGGISNWRKSIFADINRDGNIDIFFQYGDSGSNHVIYYSDGKGNFPSRAYLWATQATSDSAVADIDGNGYKDIITTAGIAIIYFLNYGDGGFSAEIVLPLTGSGTSITAADFDGDGDIDILCEGNQAELLINRLNEGMGFTSRIIHSNTTTKCSAADVDDDGDLDIIETSNADPAVRIRLNNGSAYFASGWSSSGITYADVITPADLDQDGDIDIYIGDSTGPTNYILKNGGNGNFTYKSLDVTNRTSSSAAGDIDLDGDLDIVIATDAGLAIYKNDGSGNLTRNRSDNDFIPDQISMGVLLR